MMLLTRARFLHKRPGDEWRMLPSSNHFRRLRAPHSDGDDSHRPPFWDSPDGTHPSRHHSPPALRIGDMESPQGRVNSGKGPFPADDAPAMRHIVAPAIEHATGRQHTLKILQPRDH